MLRDCSFESHIIIIQSWYCHCERLHYYNNYYYYFIIRGMQSIVGRAELAIAVQPHRRAAELSGLLYNVIVHACSTEPRPLHC